MRKNKITLLIVSMMLIVTMIGCSPADKNMNRLSTQTRIQDDNLNNKFMKDNTPLNERDGVNNLNNGMTRNTRDLGDNERRDNTQLNNGMTRPNNRLTTSLSNTSDRATTIAQRVTALPEINNASVIINGNTAIVGCDVKDSKDNKLTNALREKVEAAVKVADRNIQNISVTSDPTIYTRIQTLSRDMNNNMDKDMKTNPITNFTKDIEDIMKQITNIK